MKRVITYGTFDLLHYGHINLLKRAKALGDYLIVAVSTDEFTRLKKDKKCYFSYEQRKGLLESVRFVDLVIPEENWDQKIKDIQQQVAYLNDQMSFMTYVQQHGMLPVPSEESAEERTYVECISALKKMRMTRKEED